jgi:6-pyruvoyltetrahydropterin/6-carboxytetrahydropterin synthase
MSYTIGTVVRFETAHRQKDDPSKCGFLHGHNWKAEISITARNLGPLGYLIDFKDIKEVINKMFDHKTLLHHEDMLVGILDDANQKVAIIMSGNPTCEVLSKIILNLIVDLVPGEVQIISIKVKLYENENSYAEVWYP